MPTHEFLKDCQSKPLTVGDLDVGETFIFFPDDGDDSGHGGFRGGGRLFVKIAPQLYEHGHTHGVAREFARPDVICSTSLTAAVIRVVGVGVAVTDNPKHRNRNLQHAILAIGVPLSWLANETTPDFGKLEGLEYELRRVDDGRHTFDAEMFFHSLRRMLTSCGILPKPTGCGVWFLEEDIKATVTKV